MLFLFLQVIIGIGAKPAVSPFESVGLNTSVGGIQVSLIVYQLWAMEMNEHLKWTTLGNQNSYNIWFQAKANE